MACFRVASGRCTWLHRPTPRMGRATSHVTPPTPAKLPKYVSLRFIWSSTVTELPSAITSSEPLPPR